MMIFRHTGDLGTRSAQGQWEHRIKKKKLIKKYIKYTKREIKINKK